MLRLRAAFAFVIFAAFSMLWTAVVLPLTAAPSLLSHTQVGLFGLVGIAGAGTIATAATAVFAGAVFAVVVAVLSIAAFVVRTRRRDRELALSTPDRGPELLPGPVRRGSPG